MTDPVPTPSKTAGPGLLEGLVALSILVSLSGVLMPVVGSEVQQSRADTAHADMQLLGGALRAYTRDTQWLPSGRQGRTDIAWLYTPGELPSGASFGDVGAGHSIADFVLVDAMGGTAWAGPYLPSDTLHADPWGNAYLVHVDGWLNGRDNPFIVSAGPDGLLETRANDRQAGGDDLVWLLR